MKEHGMYLGKETIYQKIRDVGGVWNDSKERPIVCLVESEECEELYWAIPVGNWDHRSEKAKKRIRRYMNLPKRNIASCFYHVGRTTVKSIFFISDVIPITDKYIEREYYGFNQNIYIIRNPKLLQDVNKKLRRILSYENTQHNHFRQHITDVKVNLMQELIEERHLNR